MNNPVMRHIVEILNDKFYVPHADLAPTARFEDLNVDSLVLAELAVILQQRLGVPVDESDLPAEMTIADAAENLSAKGVAA
ncbi:acyl carrier protein [Krasilnikovia sp. M28-CT-15]|uniref:acyl carrier protein n=1 Tax=Krasilnikovia sp. M28-CT-15 TaxID=3373540 RepID=UPI003876E7A6